MGGFSDDSNGGASPLAWWEMIKYASGELGLKESGYARDAIAEAGGVSKEVRVHADAALRNQVGQGDRHVGGTQQIYLASDGADLIMAVHQGK